MSDPLIAAAWREYQVAAGFRGEYLVHFGDEPPAWFRLRECGMAIEHGPSLRWTCETLAKQNRAALAQLGADAPTKVTYPTDLDRSRLRGGRSKKNTKRTDRSARVIATAAKALAIQPPADDHIAFGLEEARRLLADLAAKTSASSDAWAA